MTFVLRLLAFLLVLAFASVFEFKMASLNSDFQSSDYAEFEREREIADDDEELGACGGIDVKSDDDSLR